MICQLKEMEEKDLPVTFAWRNEEQVLRAAMTNKPISYNEHEALFKYNNSVKLVFSIDNVPTGYISCSKDPDEPIGEWGFHLAPEARKKGYSQIMLRMGLIELQKRGYTRIYAKVKKSNIPSIHLHNKLGFYELDSDYNDQFIRYAKDLW